MEVTKSYKSFVWSEFDEKAEFQKNNKFINNMVGSKSDSDDVDMNTEQKNEISIFVTAERIKGVQLFQRDMMRCLLLHKVHMRLEWQR